MGNDVRDVRRVKCDDWWQFDALKVICGRDIYSGRWQEAGSTSQESSGPSAVSGTLKSPLPRRMKARIFTRPTEPKYVVYEDVARSNSNELEDIISG
jgi:hypothetical protein